MLPERNERPVLIGLLLLNLGLKLSWLDVTELAHDEPFTVHWSQQSLGALWAMMHTENNPPLYFLLIKGWSALVPFEVPWLRLPSALFSAFAVWPLYLLASRVSGMRVALVTCLLFTFSNYHYGFAHEVRAYSLFTLLSIASIGLLVRGKDRQNKGYGTLVGLSALNLVLIYTHFFGWLMIGTELAMVVLLPELRPMRRDFLVGLGLTILGYLPYASVFLGRFGQSVSQGTWLDKPVPEELYNMIWRWSNAPVLAVLFLTVLAIAAWRNRLQDPGLRIGLFWSLVPLLGMFMASFLAPMFLDRYLVYAAPGFAWSVAIALTMAMQGDRIRTALPVVAVLGMLATFTPWKDTGRHPSHVVAQVEDWCTAECGLAILPSWYGLTYLAARDINLLQQPTSGIMDLGTPQRSDALPGKLPGGSPIGVPDTILVVLAGMPPMDDRPIWYHSLRNTHKRVDSIEVDHKVWVQRFSR